MSVKRIRPPSIYNFKSDNDTKEIPIIAKDLQPEISEEEELEANFFKSAMRYRSVSTVSSPQKQRNRELIFLNKKQITNIVLTENKLQQIQNRRKDKELRELNTPEKTPASTPLKILRQPSLSSARFTQDLPILSTEAYSATPFGRSTRFASPIPPTITQSSLPETRKRIFIRKLSTEDSGIVKSKTIQLIRSLQDRLYGANVNQLKRINALLSKKKTSEKDRILQENKKYVNTLNSIENPDEEQIVVEEPDYYRIDTENEKIQKVYKNFDLYQYNPLSDNFQFTANPDPTEIESLLKSLGKIRKPVETPNPKPKPKPTLEDLNFFSLSKRSTSISGINKNDLQKAAPSISKNTLKLRAHKSFAQQGSRTERFYEKTKQKILKFPDPEKPNSRRKSSSISKRVLSENREFIQQYKRTIENIL